MIRAFRLPLGIIMLFASYIGSIEAFAQRSDFNQKLWIGLGGGTHLEEMIFIPKVQQKLHIGKLGSFMLRWDVENHCSLQLEANYSEQGWTEVYDDQAKSFGRNLVHVQVPMLTHLYLEKKNARFFVNLGPQLGYLMGDKITHSAGDFTEAEALRHQMPVVNKFSWGLTGGLGAGYVVGRRFIVEAEARFNYNFNDIFSTKRSDPYGQASEMWVSARLNFLFLLFGR